MATRSEMLAALRHARSQGDAARAESLARKIAAYDGEQPTSTAGKALQAVDDYMRVGAEGLTLGWADKTSAAGNTLIGNIASTLGVGEDVDYADELARQRDYSAQSRERMNEDIPYSAEAVEIGTSLVGPGKIAKAVPKVLWPALGAAAGYVSAEGHDADPLTGTIVGGVGGAAGPMVSGLMSRAAPLVSRGAGAVAGSFFGSPTAGAIVGGGATAPIRSVGNWLSSGSGRDLLALLSMAPGAAGQPAANAVEKMPFVEGVRTPPLVERGREWWQGQ